MTSRSDVTFLAQIWIHGSSCASRAVGRFLGSACSSRFTKALPSELICSHTSHGSKCTCALRMLCFTRSMFSPSNPPKGVSPHSSRYVMTPSAHRSHFSSYEPRMISGATVYGVPTFWIIDSPISKCLLKPKSIIWTRGERSMLGSAHVVHGEAMRQQYVQYEST